MIKTIVKIDGMVCGMCEAHVCGAIRRAVPEAGKVAADRRKKEAVLLTENRPDANALRAAVEAAGYVCTGMESVPDEKKGLFGWR